MSNEENLPKFELGLVGAGAISAGAYSAGVIDFLVQALDVWYAAKAAGHPAAPLHEVSLPVFSGASAGGMTAALACGYLASDQPPICTPEQGRQLAGANKLFDAWVERIDMARLLESRDLHERHQAVVSLLDSTVLAEIAEAGLDVQPRTQRRAYLADNFQVLLTVTNLRGIPYSFRVDSDHPASYDMSLHADHLKFNFSDTASAGQCGSYNLTWSGLAGPSVVKDQLKQAALASGAFPFGLAPRTLSHAMAGAQPDWYSSRLWPVPTPDEPFPGHHCTELRPIPVNWGQAAPPAVYEFQCVDGGVMNNEPLELARQVLAGHGGHNPRSGDLAHKAVVLIDPFPSQCAFDATYRPEPDLLGLGKKLFAALTNQARFKPDELLLAAESQGYSRFMIAPSREGSTVPIACGALGGFGGFLKRDFREHDFFLGRRNAQQFLRQYLVLPENNPLFTRWTPAQRELHCVKGSNQAPLLVNGQRQLPIIPLLGAANMDCPLLEWPRYSEADLAALNQRIQERCKNVFTRLMDQLFKNNHPLLRWAAGFILGRKVDDVARDLAAMVRKNLQGDMKLMR